MSLVLDQPERVGAWVAQQVEQSAPWGSFYAMGVEREGEIVAGLVMNNYNGSNATAHVAAARCGKEFMALVDEFVRGYIFGQLALSRLTAMVPADKPRAIGFVRRIGFVDEFVMRRGAPNDEDMNVLVLWPENYRNPLKGAAT